MNMRSTLTGIVFTLATIATPSLAQSTSGTVTIDGSVDTKCLVTDPGAVAGPDFGGIIHLNALDDGTTGKLRNIGTVSSASNANLNFRVVCTTAAPSVSVATTALTTGAGTAPTGYAAKVHYDSTVAFDIADAGSPDSVQTYTDGLTGPASKSATLTGRLATGTTNIHVSATNFHTPAANAVLVSGNYSGAIAITVSPN